MTLTREQRRRLDAEILSLRLALLGPMPAAKRIGLEAELRDLRLARAGIEGPHTRARLASVGVAGAVLHRGPNEWGTATRVHVS